MTDTVASIMVEAPVLPPDACGEAAYEAFSADPDLLVCAVVADGAPCGLLTRDRFFLRMADRFGRALYSKRPVTFVMQPDPLLVPHDTPLEELNAHILEARPAALLDGFVVTKHGRYHGVGSTLGLFSAAVQAADERSARLEKLAAELSVAERQARESAHAKGQFLATMSHEIRTPLNGVLGLSALLARSDMKPEQAQLAETIHRSGQMLLTLLNNILDLSRLEAGGVALHPEPFTLNALAQEMRDLWAAQAQEQNVAFTVTVEDAAAETVSADLLRIRQVLINLIGNALKFTHRGEVRVRLSLRETGADAAAISMEVSDTGVGIAEDAKAVIFDAFRQADSSVTRRYGGSGLGLAICKHLVDLMDGRISFDSEAGAGSVFRVTVPVMHAAQAAAA